MQKRWIGLLLVTGVVSGFSTKQVSLVGGELGRSLGPSDECRCCAQGDLLSVPWHDFNLGSEYDDLCGTPASLAAVDLPSFPADAHEFLERAVQSDSTVAFEGTGSDMFNRAGWVLPVPRIGDPELRCDSDGKECKSASAPYLPPAENHPGFHPSPVDGDCDTHSNCSPVEEQDLFALFEALDQGNYVAVAHGFRLHEAAMIVNVDRRLLQILNCARNGVILQASIDLERLSAALGQRP